MSDTFDENQLSFLLLLYYKRIFPQSQFTRWISYENNAYLSNREISFTTKDDLYFRFLSYINPKQFVEDLIKKCPVKIDIGAVYNMRLSLKNNSNFMPMEKELVFDIDLTDYDDIRTCCQEASICNKCWKFMQIACKILDAALRADFGYKHLLWVFSGRRGIHCWVCDKSARLLHETERNCIAEYLQLITGGVNQFKKVNLPYGRIHPSITRALEIIDSYFIKDIVINQDILGTDERLEDFLKIIPSNIRDKFKEAMTPLKTSNERWTEFVETFNQLFQRGLVLRNARNLVDEIKLQFAYPRLDINVTKGFSHLLKAPFCVHPKTGKIAVPFNPKTVSNFDPLTVPTVSRVINDINIFDEKTKSIESSFSENNGSSGNINKIRDYKKTCLFDSVRVFDEFLKPLLSDEKKYRKEENHEEVSMDF